MDVGLFLNTQWHKHETASVADITAQANAARDAGFDSVWLPHHYLTEPMQMMQPFTLLGYLVPETGNMLLGMDILLLPMLSPTMVAEEWATLDVLSGGGPCWASAWGRVRKSSRPWGFLAVSAHRGWPRAWS